jgi:formyltetrahydrofolate synthetase
MPVVVALNRFPGDTGAAEQLVLDEAVRSGADDAVVNDVFSRGGEGGVDLARAVVERARGPIEPHFAYDPGDPIADKIEAVARTVYGADSIELGTAARKNIAMLEDNGLGHLPVCIAKTPLSLSHDPTRLGRPRGFTLPIEDIRPATGAGFLYPLAGKIFTMPGLPVDPAACDMDLEV